MAAFFAWGNKPNSFVVANGTLLDYQNMPDEYEGKFKMNEWNALTVSNICTGPSGYHWVKLYHDQTWIARGPKEMLPWLSTDVLGRGSVKYVAFAPSNNAWFARYSNNDILFGHEMTDFPSTFQDIVTSLCESHPREDKAIDFVTFGAHDMIIVRYENGNSQLVLPTDEDVRGKSSQALIDLINKKLEEGWTVGNRTTLCQWDPERYFIEWKRGTTAEFNFNMGAGRQEDLARVKSVLDGVGNDEAAVRQSQNATLFAAQARLIHMSHRRW